MGCDRARGPHDDGQPHGPGVQLLPRALHRRQRPACLPDDLSCHERRLPLQGRPARHGSQRLARLRQPGRFPRLRRSHAAVPRRRRRRDGITGGADRHPGRRDVRSACIPTLLRTPCGGFPRGAGHSRRPDRSGDVLAVVHRHARRQHEPRQQRRNVRLREQRLRGLRNRGQPRRRQLRSNVGHEPSASRRPARRPTGCVVGRSRQRRRILSGRHLPGACAFTRRRVSLPDDRRRKRHDRRAHDHTAEPSGGHMPAADGRLLWRVLRRPCVPDAERHDRECR